MNNSNEINKLVESYNLLVKGIEQQANDDLERSYGGIIRASKDLMVENITREIIKIAWKELEKNETDLSFHKNTIKIPLNKDYLKKIKSNEVLNYIK